MLLCLTHYCITVCIFSTIINQELLNVFLLEKRDLWLVYNRSAYSHSQGCVGHTVHRHTHIVLMSHIDSFILPVSYE